MRESAVNFGVLHRICTLVVLLCFVHISVTVVYYVRSLDVRGTFLQNQQTKPGQNYNRLHPVTKAAPVKRENADANLVTVEAEALTQCPDDPPLLGKYSFFFFFGRLNH